MNKIFRVITVSLTLLCKDIFHDAIAYAIVTETKREHMFRWLSEHTANILSWGHAILDIIEYAQEAYDNGHDVESLKQAIDDFEQAEWPEQIWDDICKAFPDLIDEYNDLKLSLFNQEHPDG